MNSVAVTGQTEDEIRVKNINATVKSRYQRKIESVQAFLSLLGQSPMSDAVINEIRKRKIKVKGKWLIDFASCNYLGFDVEPEVMASVSDHVQKLTTYPGQSRLLGSPYLYEEIEKELVRLTGAPDCILFPSITLLHLFALPILAEEGDLFLDKRAHKTIYDGCMRATQYGAKLFSFAHNDCDDLEEKLKVSQAKKKIVCVDAVYSMHGYNAPVSELLALCEKYDAYLYIDDAHGFGVLGERGSDELCPFGKKGNGIIAHYGASYDRVIFIGGLSKAYSALLGFITCTPETKDFLKVAIDPYLYSGPSPIANLSCLMKSFEINRSRGDEIRAHLYAISEKLEEAIDELGYFNENHTGFPVYRLTMEKDEDLHFVGEFLHNNGIYVTLAPYPLVPRHEAGFRIQLTAANTEEEVFYLIEILKRLDKYVKIKRNDGTALKVHIDSVNVKKSLCDQVENRPSRSQAVENLK